MFEVKKVRKSDFIETFWNWSESHSFSRMDAELLPKSALVCYSGEVPVYCLWWWSTDSKTAIVTYVMSNKEASIEQKRGGLDALLEEMIFFAKDEGVKMIFFPTSSDVVGNKLLELGFSEGDSGFGQFFGYI